MPPYSRGTETALLKWVNTFPLDSKVESLAELSDAVVLCAMLEDIDSQYAVNDLEKHASPSKWLAKKKCLEAVYRSLLRYIRNHTLELDYLTLETTINLDAIAEHDDVQETIKLLTIFLMAAVNGPAKEKYIGNIMSQLDESAQLQIMDLIQTLGKLEDAPPTSNTADTALPEKLTKDLQLAFEEEHATLHLEHEALKKKHADFITRFEHLQANNDDLHEQNDKIEEQLRALQESNSGDQAVYIKNLQKQIEERDELIATHEQEAEINRVTKEKQSRELAALRPSAQRLSELEDDVKVLKTENASLTKKANMVDHFQKKLELQSGIERENAKLRERIDILQGNQNDFDKVYEENETLKTTIGEYKKRFQTYEDEVMTLTTQKSTLQAENRFNAEQISQLLASKTHDEEFIKGLQEQINSGDQHHASEASGRPSGLTLEEELEQSDDPTPNLLLEISRLKAENQFLKSGNAGTSNAELRTELDESERKFKRLEENFQGVTEENAIVREQLRAVLSSSSNEKDEAIAQTRRLYLEANQDLSAAKSKVAELEATVSQRDRELLSAKTDLSAVDREEIDALESLKSTHQIITSSVQNELLLVQSKLKNLTTDHELQKSHLIASMLAKEKLQQEIATLKEGKDSDSDETNAALKALKEQTEKQEQVIQDLHQRLSAAEETGAEGQKAAYEAEKKTLQRENAMITAAWYDLTNRLQSNHVVVQRRQDSQKSWLKKQRQMVVGSPRQ